MPERPRLSVAGITRNSAHRLERWAALAREFADEITLLVDDSSTDDTVEVARRVCDRVQVTQHAPFIEYAMDWGLRQATGEWVLWLDDDEVLDPRFPEVLDELLSDPDVTHYWQPYRWLVRTGEAADSGYGWLGAFPWYPDRRLRLIRRVGSTFSHRGRLHSPIDVQGEGRLLEDERTVIYHLDFVLADRAARERKIAGYSGHRAPSCSEYYRWEDYAGSVPVHPVDPAIVEREPAPARPHVSHAAAAEPEWISLERMQAAIARFQPNADVFGAEYRVLDCPTTLLPNRGYTAYLDIVNRSATTWRTTGPEAGRVELSYHWSSAEYGTLLRDGDVTLLPGPVAAGAATGRVPAGFWSPYSPGRYRLEWDLRCGEAGWFSEHGIAPQVVEIEVVADPDHQLRDVTRAVARLPARAERTAAPPSPPASPASARPLDQLRRRVRAKAVEGARRAAARLVPPSAETPAANLVPIRPVRVLDTRDGTGVPGAPRGPIAGGTVIELDVLAVPAIPDTAVGVVGTLCVVSADYHGFVTVSEAVGSRPDATVTVYFNDAGPAAGQVTARLGSGASLGRLAIAVSEYEGGTVQLLLDVTGYLD